MFGGAVAYFNDPNPDSALSDLAATIDWGDGFTTTGTIVPSPGTTGKSDVINGTHLYATDSIAPLSIRVSAKAGSTITISNPATIEGGADLIVAQTVQPGTGDMAAQSQTFTVSVTNNDQQTRATNVVLTDTPSNATFGPQSSSNLIAQMSSNGASHTWTLPQLAPGATLTVTFTLYSPAVGQFSNTAIVKADQPSLSCRSYSSTIHTWATDSSSGGPPPQSPTQNYIAGVYRDLLGRQPDSGGLSYWDGKLASGATRDVVAQQLTHTPEYFQTIINPAYEQYLGRAPDASGLEYWIQKMQAGLTDESLEAGFMASGEFYQHSGGTNQGWVDGMYQGLLGRQPDAQGEAFWVGQLNSGAHRFVVAYGFAASAEREAQRVADDYFNYLGRAANQDDVDYWVNQFKGGVTNEDVIHGFISSPEYYGDVSSPQTASPTSVLALSGQFDPTADTQVVFTNEAGEPIPVTPISVMPNQILVAVPPFAGGNDLLALADLSVAVRQTSAGGVVTRPSIHDLRVGAVPDTGLPTGTLTDIYLGGVLAQADAALQDYQAIAAASGGTVNTTTFVGDIDSFRQTVADLKSSVDAVATGAFSGVALPIVTGNQPTLDYAALSITDRMIAASVIAQSGSTNVSGQALSDLVKSRFAPDPEHELQLIEQTELVESVAITLVTVFAAVAAPEAAPLIFELGSGLSLATTLETVVFGAIQIAKAEYLAAELRGDSTLPLASYPLTEAFLRKSAIEIVAVKLLGAGIKPYLDGDKGLAEILAEWVVRDAEKFSDDLSFVEDAIGNDLTTIIAAFRSPGGVGGGGVRVTIQSGQRSGTWVSAAKRRAIRQPSARCDGAVLAGRSTLFSPGAVDGGFDFEVADQQQVDDVRGAVGLIKANRSTGRRRHHQLTARDSMLPPIRQMDDKRLKWLRIIESSDLLDGHGN